MRSLAARAGGMVFDERAMLASALGRPSAAFGDDYRKFDGAFILPRLPSAPYLFISRILRVEGPQNGMQLGSVAVAECEVPSDAWYVQENGRRTIPFGVLLEIALQPCGWLATYVGCVLGAKEAVTVRNLDGTGDRSTPRCLRDVGQP